jgi:hypothetical protein
MKLSKFLKTFLLLNIILLTSCASVKDAVTGKQKKVGDEFLVEKKNPLTMPPEFGEMPVPIKEEKEEEESIKGIKELLIKIPKENQKKQTSKSSPTSLEKSILKSINKD